MKKKSAPAGLIVALVLGAFVYFKTGGAPQQQVGRMDAGAAPVATAAPERGGGLTFESSKGYEGASSEQGRSTPSGQTKVVIQLDPGKTSESAQRHSGPTEFAPYQVSGVRVVDINTGRTLPMDKVDLRPTLRRIEQGGRNSHRNDGTVFRNAQHKLPRHASGYYREYVVPTSGLRGPGPQRLVIGEKGEIYYTFDHYESFIQLHGGN